MICEKHSLTNIRFQVLDLIDEEREKYKILDQNTDAMIIADANEGLLIVKLSECEKMFQTKVLSKMNKVLLTKQESRKKKLIKEYCFGISSTNLLFDFDFNVYIVRDESPQKTSGPFSVLDLISDCTKVN